MKKTFIILGMAALLAVGFSSCRKLMCQCEAVGPADKVETILNKHISDCVEIADQGGTIHDSGVTVTCSY